MDEITAAELGELYPSSDEASDRELQHVMQKARKYHPNNNGKGRRPNSNPGKRKSKYEQYLHAAGGMLARKTGQNAGQAMGGGKAGGAAGRLIGMFLSSPSKFGDDPSKIISTAVGRKGRKRGRGNGRRRGGGRKGRGGRGGHGGRSGRGGHGGRGGRGGRGGHGGQRGRGGGRQGGHKGGRGSRDIDFSQLQAGENKDAGGEEEADYDSGYESDSSGTSSEWNE